jgi:hypothetical protein
VLGWGNREWKIFPFQNSPSPCAPRSHKCHCSIPIKTINIWNNSVDSIC